MNFTTRTALATALALAAGGAAADDPAPAVADDSAPAAGAFPQGWYVTPMLSYTRADRARGTGNGRGMVAALGHRSDIAAVELDAYYSKLPGRGGAPGDAKLTGGVLALVVGPFFEQDFLSRLFAVVGFGALREQNVPTLAEADTSSIVGEAGLGYLQPFELWGLRVNARAEARYRYDYQQPPHAPNTPTDFHDTVFNLGLQVALSREAVLTEAAAPAAVVPVADTDNDGVNDDRDQCPDTPPGSYVSNVGCPAPAVAPAGPTAAAEPAALETAKAGDTIVLKGVTFESGRAKLRADSRTILDGVAEALQKRPELKVEVGGHTDDRGADDYNQALSQRRADAVLGYLVEHGVDAAGLSAVGYGEAQPVDGNDTDEGRERNRRVELKILQ
jgi:outer membrane protein OmpA-like peptidoglycan-associated protein